MERRRASTQRRGYSPLLWLNLVCLDAPIVAVAWQELFATTFAVAVSPANRAALFLTAWLIYLADRFGDSVSLPRNARRSRRQEFCARYRKLWLGAIGFLALADVYLIATRLEFGAVVAGVVIGGIALIYLVVNQRWSQLWRILPVKELTIGLLFAAGTMVGLVSGLTKAVLPGWWLFAGLCSLNCVCIAVWERELDVAQGRISIATVFPHVERYLWPIFLLFVIACFAGPASRAIGVCLATSTLLLAGVHFWRDGISPDVRTALADLVLLTPLAIVIARPLISGPSG